MLSNLKNSFYEAKGKIEIKFQLMRYVPVFIFQMGKVGSTSIHRSLERQYKGLVVHDHNFSSGMLNKKVSSLYSYYYPKKNKKIKIISLVREPIGRNVSAFFQNFQRDTGVKYENSKFNIEELKEIFLKNYAHDIPLNWFENIYYHFGIDVYSKPFPEEGYILYSNNRGVDLLLMRHDLDNQLKGKKVSEFVGISDLKIENVNLGENKNYAKTYKEFRNHVKLPLSYIEKMRGSKYFRHFYDKDTINRVCEEWSENPRLTI